MNIKVASAAVCDVCMTYVRVPVSQIRARSVTETSWFMAVLSRQPGRFTAIDDKCFSRLHIGNCRGSGLCPSSGIVETGKQRFGNWI
jgi:hypothetical protein